MFDKVLPGKTSDLLAVLSQASPIREAYLAGGTALALQLGHRYSFDLDFFTPQPFNEQTLLKEIEPVAPFKLRTLKWRTIMGDFGDIKFSIFYYEYPLLFPPLTYRGARVADCRDIAAMKIAAVSGRGTRRDYVDLYALTQHGISLEEAIQLYDQKYKNLGEAAIHILKALTFFDDAEQDEMPRMIQNLKWKDVRAFFETEARRIARDIIKIG